MLLCGVMRPQRTQPTLSSPLRVGMGGHGSHTGAATQAHQCWQQPVNSWQKGKTLLTPQPSRRTSWRTIRSPQASEHFLQTRPGHCPGAFRHSGQNLESLTCRCGLLSTSPPHTECAKCWGTMEQGVLSPQPLVRAKDCFPQCLARPDRGLPVASLP